jgi:hypothetical protein
MEIVARQRVRYVFKDDIDDYPNQDKTEPKPFFATEDSEITEVKYKAESCYYEILKAFLCVLGILCGESVVPRPFQQGVRGTIP